MSDYKPGQFSGAKSAALPGGPRNPFMNELPIGTYVGQVLSMEGGQTRNRVDKFKSVYKVVDRIVEAGEEKGSFPREVDRLELASGNYYLSSIKAEILAAMGGKIDILDENDEPTGETRDIKADDIGEEVMVEAVTNGIFDGALVLIKVWEQKAKDSGNIYRNARTYPLPDDLREQYSA